MDDHRPLQPDLSEQLDACRFDSADLDLPELRELAARVAADPDVRTSLDRIQRTDRRIAQAIGDAPVPEGLSDRLLAALAQGQQSISVAPEADESIAEPAPSLSLAHDRQRRRRLQWVSALVATAAGLFIAIGLLWRGESPEISLDDAISQASVLHASAGILDNQEFSLAETPTLARYTPDQAVWAPPSTTTWRKVHDFLGRSGVAYRIARKGVQATLYVLDLKGRRDAPQIIGLPLSAPAMPQSTSGGRMIACWQSPEALFVLVVEGGRRDYPMFVEPAGTLAQISTRPSRPAAILLSGALDAASRCVASKNALI